jgi:hypothetical protein
MELQRVALLQREMEISYSVLQKFLKSFPKSYHYLENFNIFHLDATYAPLYSGNSAKGVCSDFSILLS